MRDQTQPAKEIENTFPIDRLCKSIDDLCNIVRRQQSRITVDVNEYNYTFNDTTLRVSPRSRNAIHITGLVAVASSNATVTVGPHVIPFTTAQSPLNLRNLSWVINADDIRQITQTTIGSMALEIFGEEYGDVGVL
jgi:hypothetical protein